MNQADVCIIGGGASAAFLVYALKDAGLRIAVVEPSENLFQGYAYSTTIATHRVNVRADRLSIAPSNTADFTAWLEARKLDPLGFVPRELFSNYLSERIAEAGVAFTHVRDAASKIARTEDGEWRVEFSNTPSVSAKRVVLASGYGLKPPPTEDDAPYTLRDLMVQKFAFSNAQVVVIGTGLTAVDIALTALAGGAKEVVCVSRSGKFPQVHTAGHHSAPGDPTIEAPFINGSSLRSVLRAWNLRRRAEREAFQWRERIDRIRPSIAGLWRGFTDEERRRFIRHLRSHWDRHRHRLGTEASDALRVEAANGRLRTLKMRLPARLKRSALTEFGLSTELVFDARGIYDERSLKSDLMRSLIKNGLSKIDRLGVGLEIDEKFNLVDESGAANPELYAIGPVCRGTIWESIAVPEIRNQAKLISESLRGLR